MNIKLGTVSLSWRCLKMKLHQLRSKPTSGCERVAAASARVSRKRPQPLGADPGCERLIFRRLSEF